MKTEIKQISPELAKQYLTHNNANRHIRKDRVALYAKQMRNGEWHLTGQGITFGKNGQLLDGQHRLMAIVESGVTVPMLVVTEADVVATYDSGLPRSLADQIRLEDPTKTGVLYGTFGLAVCKAAYELSHGIYFNNARASTDELLWFIERHHLVLEWLIKLYYSGPKGVRRSIIPATMFCMLGADILTSAQIEHIAYVMVTGVTKDEADCPIIGLRNKLITGYGRTGIANRDMWLRIQYAVKAYLAGSTSTINKPIAKSYELDFLADKNKEEK